MALVCLNIAVGFRQRDHNPEQSRDYILPSHVARTIASKIPTLHYVALSRTTVLHNDRNKCRWWRVFRSEKAGEGPSLEKVPNLEGANIQERFWSMDRQSLLNFDIDTFLKED